MWSGQLRGNKHSESSMGAERTDEAVVCREGVTFEGFVGSVQSFRFCEPVRTGRVNAIHNKEDCSEKLTIGIQIIRSVELRSFGELVS